MSGPLPKVMAASGMSATDGIGRRNSTRVMAALRTDATLPSSSPAGTATAIATHTAISVASTVATTARRNSVSPSSAAIAGRTVLGGTR
ncbi:hypothetical protein ACFQV2_02600 [Actinokineospora soli]|uniref:Uncharacterized protein n=1 Tax=Actinokineospora soli TaxID=1048753 RepID=A0ABW2TJD4_9PSEU